MSVDSDRARLRTVFMGSPEFAVPCLRATARATDLAAVVTQPDRPAGRGRQLVEPAVKVAARALAVPVLQPTTLRDGTLLASLREIEPDLIVVVAYGRILPEAILELPRYGCINVHASLLPRWRGAAPIQRAVLAGDTETGVTIMRLDRGCDTGPVYRREAIAIGSEETSGELFARLAELGAGVLEPFLAEFPGVPPPQAQPDEGVTHAAKLDKSEGWIDWSATTTQVINHVRGMDPWPGAQTRRGATIMRLFGASRADRVVTSPSPRPGTVLALGASGLEIACGDGSLWIAEVQVAGKRRMSALEYQRGQPLTVGEMLA